MIDIHYHDACPDELLDEDGEPVDLELMARENEMARDRYIDDCRDWQDRSDSLRGY